MGSPRIIIKSMEDVRVIKERPTSSEFKQIVDRLYRMQSELSTPLTVMGEESVVRRNLVKFAEANQIIKVYSKDFKTFYGIVIYDKGCHWYSDWPVLFEQEVLCVHDAVVGFGRVALEILEKEAVVYGCLCVVAGNTGNDKAVDNLYINRGYMVTNTFMKEVK